MANNFNLEKNITGPNAFFDCKRMRAHTHPHTHGHGVNLAKGDRDAKEDTWMTVDAHHQDEKHRIRPSLCAEDH